MCRAVKNHVLAGGGSGRREMPECGAVRSTSLWDRRRRSTSFCAERVWSWCSWCVFVPHFRADGTGQEALDISRIYLMCFVFFSYEYITIFSF